MFFFSVSGFVQKLIVLCMELFIFAFLGMPLFGNMGFTRKVSGDGHAHVLPFDSRLWVSL